ncbi:MAG: site-2 protease family protein [Oscillospiraceae bacterium]
MNSFQTFWNGLDWSVLTDMLLSVIPALLCITLHELAHGYVAYRLGDRTAKDAGRLTLNPIRHIDIMGLLMMVVFKFGWAKPVPVDMRSFKNPKRDMAITALAGPLCNLLLCCVLLFVYGLVFSPLIRWGTGTADVLLQMLATASYLSLALALFNLIPISPLDGSKVLFSFLNEEHYRKLMRYERYGMILLLVLVATGVFGSPLSKATGFLYDKLFVLAEWGFQLMNKLIG